MVDDSTMAETGGGLAEVVCSVVEPPVSVPCGFVSFVGRVC